MTYNSSNLLKASPFVADSALSFKLGTRAVFNHGTNEDLFVEAVYIEADATLTAGQVCELPLISGTDAFVVDTPLTTTNAATLTDAQYERFAACVPLADLVDGEYGWAAVKGIIPIKLAASCEGQQLLFLTTTAGVLQHTDTDYEVEGVFSTATITTAATTNCIAYHDLFVRRDAAV